MDPTQQDVKKSNKSKKGNQKSKRREENSDDEDEEEDENAAGKRFAVELLLRDDGANPGFNDATEIDLHSRMKITGKMNTCSFLHPRATVGDAVRAVKTDILRSLRGRIQMHCDSLVGEELKGTEEEGVRKSISSVILTESMSFKIHRRLYRYL